MAQNTPPFCTKCGAPLQVNQKFCTNCGATMVENANSPTEMASNVSNNSSPAQLARPTPNIPIPPPPPGALGPTAFTLDANTPAFAPPPPNSETYATLTAGINTPPPPPPPAFSPYSNSASGASTYPDVANRFAGYNAQSAPITSAPVPAYAQKPRRNNGCVFTSIILLLILAAGIGGFILVYTHFISGNNSNAQSNSGNYSANNGSDSSGNTPATTISSSEQLNLSLVYASVNVTIQSVQEAQSFANDNDTSGQTAVVRVNLLENNATAQNPEYAEGDVMLLVLPDGSTVTPGNEQAGISPDAGVKRTNWIDFGVSQQVTLTQLTLRFGTPKENQMDIPLKSGADLSKYQDKTVSPNSTFQYANLTWTLKTATLSYSYNDQQATTGNRYVVITLAAANSTTNTFEGDTGSYIRLQTSGISSPPADIATFPISVAADSNASGVVAFLVPQNSSSFTLVMLGQQTSPPINQATQAFNIP